MKAEGLRLYSKKSTLVMTGKCEGRSHMVGKDDTVNCLSITCALGTLFLLGGVSNVLFPKCNRVVIILLSPPQHVWVGFQLILVQ